MTNIWVNNFERQLSSYNTYSRAVQEVIDSISEQETIENVKEVLKEKYGVEEPCLIVGKNQVYAPTLEVYTKGPSSYNYTAIFALSKSSPEVVLIKDVGDLFNFLSSLAPIFGMCCGGDRPNRFYH